MTDATAADTSLQEFRIAVSDEELDDLHRRLRSARWTEELADAAWSDGITPQAMHRLVERWLDGYDWRAVEERLNRRRQITTVIDGQRIHAVVAPSARADAIPLLLLHGWPSTFAEFEPVIDALTSPPSSDDVAFHVVVPSVPGYAFSGPTTERGWTSARIARAFAELMARLGHTGYVAHGADLGFHISSDLAVLDPAHVRAIHLNLGGVRQAGKRQHEPSASEAEADAKRRQAHYLADMSAYALLQATRPQTLSYMLIDSPIAQLAWVGEKFHEWTDPGHPVADDDVLTAASLYWFTRTGGSAARFYQSGYGEARMGRRPFVTTPTGVSVWPHDIVPALRHWTEEEYNVTYWADMPAGAHFAALETPDLLVQTLRRFAATL
ncbi:epoxide hydrolase family protein [Microbacterium sp. No. 7]|uniref:epoxide hydrolase family protein n=1 Tax=Microbacterium sp. No. 7 TaxID=1714373 RepID=UPI0006CFC0D5|nr:epoxide hydrolase family protein [Microbacterium sp. No. 7]ALJ18824.1 hypothetical protein AOA12_02405 [Microbacterium sp. No. 7]